MTKEKLDAFMDTALYDLSSEVGMGEYSFYVDPERGGRILKQFYDKVCADQREAIGKAIVLLPKTRTQSAERIDWLLTLNDVLFAVETAGIVEAK